MQAKTTKKNKINKKVQNSNVWQCLTGKLKKIWHNANNNNTNKDCCIYECQMSATQLHKQTDKR